MVELNIKALHHLTGAFLPHMVEQGVGAVLNVASLAAFQPIPNMATYAASKAFVASFSEAVHSELQGTGVTVTVLCPGPVHTEFGETAGVSHLEQRSPELSYVGATKVAKDAIDAMAAGRRTVVPTLKWKATGVAGRLVPRTLYLPIAKRVAR
jgi:short-subunit dehydrogenase